jgi:5-methylcytosine-specific restriction endonuclease McrA
MSYCSATCSKLHLKSLYRQKHREKLRAYNREYRKRRVYGMPVAEWKRQPRRRKDLLRLQAIRKQLIVKLGNRCRMCGTTENLTINHIIPVSVGGTSEESNLEVLCGRHNTLEYQRIVAKALKMYFQTLLAA